MKILFAICAVIISTTSASEVPLELQLRSESMFTVSNPLLLLRRPIDGSECNLVHVNGDQLEEQFEDANETEVSLMRFLDSIPPLRTLKNTAPLVKFIVFALLMLAQGLTGENLSVLFPKVLLLLIFMYAVKGLQPACELALGRLLQIWLPGSNLVLMALLMVLSMRSMQVSTPYANVFFMFSLLLFIVGMNRFAILSGMMAVNMNDTN